MQRDCYRKLVEWNNEGDRKPLVVMGARQVGKTWLMNEFAQREYPNNHVVVNFMRKKSLCKQLKDDDIDPANLIRLLQTATGKIIEPGRTLLILDEIQQCPSALTALKFFNEDMPGLAVMAAGSLLGLSYGKSSDDSDDESDSDEDESFPVGKVDRLNMYPMTFAEFLKADGKESLVKAIEDGDWHTVAMLSKDYEKELKNYFVVGGMPGAVSKWVDTGSLAKARQVQLRVLADYDDDIKKHVKRKSARDEIFPRIRHLWHNIPSQLAKENEKFVYSALRHGARARDYEYAIEWLKDAGLVRILYRTGTPHLPISHHLDLRAFKLFVHDVGLLGAMSSLEPSVVLDGNDLFDCFKGALTEQFVLQELTARGVECGYWTSDSGISEVDFVVQGRTGVYPLEVKSATNTKAKSLGVYMSEYQPAQAFKSSLKNYSDSRDVKSIPLYALGIALPSMLV